jgi:hypothetical protein
LEKAKSNSQLKESSSLQREESQGIEVKDLASFDSHVTSYGRAATEEEQKLYPIAALLKLFGMSSQDFDYKLKRYVSTPRNWNCRDDFDDTEDEEYLDYLLGEGV